jgi:hypothetical protein
MRSAWDCLLGFEATGASVWGDPPDGPCAGAVPFQ